MSVIGYKYFLGVHAALCHGVIDRVLQLRFDDKIAHIHGSTDSNTMEVNAPELFGGSTREGGVGGTVEIANGAPDQAQDPYLLSVMGSNVPAFRGIAALIFKSFYFGMNPYLKPFSTLAQRVHKREDGRAQWYDERSAIYYSPEHVHFVIYTDSEIGFPENPNHMYLANYNAELEFFFDRLWSFVQSTGLDYSITVVNATYTNSPTYNNPSSTVFDTLKNQAKIYAQAPGIGGYGTSYYMPGNDSEYPNPSAFGGYPYRSFGFANTISNLPVYNQQLNITFGVDSKATVTRAILTVAGPVLSTSRRAEGAAVARPVIERWPTIQQGQEVYDVGIIDYGIGESGTNLNAFTNFGAPALAPYVYPTTVSVPEYESEGLGWVMFNMATRETRAALTAMNPAHMIRECLTESWGMGHSEDDIDETTFRLSADKLFQERFGLCMLWDKQIPIEEFIANIVRHIDATLTVSRVTGKYELRLVRADYDVGTLLVLNATNVKSVGNFIRRAANDSVNSVTVRYTDGDTWNDASVEAQDIAAIHNQGVVVNTTIVYEGIVNSRTASIVAERDLRALSGDLASCTITATYVAKDLIVGTPFILDWPSVKANNLVMRVSSINIGDGRSMTVKITATEDVFTTPEETYIVVNPTQWQSPSGATRASPHVKPFELPYYLMVLLKTQVTVDATLTAAPEAGYLAIAAAPAQNAVNANMLVNSGTSYVNAGTMPFCGFAVTAIEVNLNTTYVTFDPADPSYATSMNLFGSPCLIMIGEEIVQVTSSTVFGVNISHRGMLDTVPAIWPAGTPVYYWSLGYGIDSVQFLLSETVDVKVQPVAGMGALTADAIEAVPYTFNARAIRPYAPGNILLNDIAWAAYPDATSTSAGPSITPPLVVSWATRNRKTQTGSVLVDQTDSSIVPEAGTTYNVRLVSLAGTVVYSETGIVGTASSAISNVGTFILEVESVRDGWTSWQKHRIPLVIEGSVPAGAILDESGDPILAEDGSFIEQEV